MTEAIPMIPNEYIAIDLEMTGLNIKSDVILEIGACHMCNGAVVNTFQALINPHRPLSEKIIELTGITQAMCDEGRELDDILPRLFSFIGELPLLGHNIRFDYSFLKQAAVNRKLSFFAPCIDTLTIARKFLPADQKKTLVALRSFYGIYSDTIHRAVDDALAAAAVYEHLKTDYLAQDASVFLPRAIQLNIKKQQPITVPQKEQLTRLLSHLCAENLCSEYELFISNPIALDQLSRSEASRMIEKLLHYN
ncbi:MAG: 3'-5' exonuclease [bacterium]|nr:3'-5' exonuclease [bacterium]